MGSKGIRGRSSPFAAASDDVIVGTRLKPQDDGARFVVDAEDFDYDVATQTGAFRSDDPRDSTYDATTGYDGGARHNFRIISDVDIWVKFGTVDDKSHYCPSANTPWEIYGREAKNIFIRSATGTAAQAQHIHTVADVSSSLNNTYFYLYAANATTGYEEKIGVWMNVGSAGTQPTDSTVDQWVSVAFAANSTNAQVGTAVEAAIEAITVPASGGTDVFTSSVSTADITVTHNAAFTGPQKNAADSTAAPTGFTFDTPTTEGAGEDATVILFMI